MTTPVPAVASPEVKAPATPVSAAALEAPKKDGTTTKLFPDMVGTRIPGAPQKAAEEKSTPASDPVPVTPEPAKVEVLDLEFLKGKQIKTVVDGKEELVSAEDAIRRIQLDSHLTQKATVLSEKERELVEREKALKRPPEPKSIESQEEESILSDDPLVKKLLSRQDALEKELEGHRAIVAKQRYVEGIERLASHVKTTLGADDFKVYLPKIEDWFKGLPPEQQRASDNDQAFVGKYQELKLKDLIAGSHAAVAPKVPEVPRPNAAPMKIEGAEGAARIQLDDWDQRYSTALAKAKGTGLEADWAEVLALKRELSKPA